MTPILQLMCLSSEVNYLVQNLAFSRDEAGVNSLFKNIYGVCTMC